MSERPIRGLSGRSFTLVELLVAVAVIGILLNLGVPAVVSGLYRARAARIVADFQVIRAAALDYYVTANDFPEDVAIGREPTELTQALSGRVRWTSPEVEYDWESWYKDRKKKDEAAFVGVTVKARDPQLIQALLRIYDGPCFFVFEDSVTCEIDTSGARFQTRPRKS